MIAFSLCLLIMVGWFKLMEVMYPPVKAPQNLATTLPDPPSPDSGMVQTQDSASQPSGAVPSIASAPPASIARSFCTASANGPVAASKGR